MAWRAVRTGSSTRIIHLDQEYAESQSCAMQMVFARMLAEACLPCTGKGSTCTNVLTLRFCGWTRVPKDVGSGQLDRRKCIQSGFSVHQVHNSFLNVPGHCSCSNGTSLQSEAEQLRLDLHRHMVQRQIGVAICVCLGDATWGGSALSFRRDVQSRVAG